MQSSGDLFLIITKAETAFVLFLMMLHGSPHPAEFDYGYQKLSFDKGIWRGERSYKTRRWSRGGSEKLNASDRAVVTAFFHYLSIILLFGHILEFTSGTSLSGFQIAGGHNCKMYIYPLPLHDSFLPNAPN